MLDDLQIDYKISNRNVNLYHKKSGSSLDEFIRDLNGFVIHKLQAPYRMVLIEQNHHRHRTSREARAYRLAIKGREHNRVRGLT